MSSVILVSFPYTSLFLNCSYKLNCSINMGMNLMWICAWYCCFLCNILFPHFGLASDALFTSEIQFRVKAEVTAICSAGVLWPPFQCQPLNLPPRTRICYQHVMSSLCLFSPSMLFCAGVLVRMVIFLLRQTLLVLSVSCFLKGLLQATPERLAEMIIVTASYANENWEDHCGSEIYLEASL